MEIESEVKKALCEKMVTFLRDFGDQPYTNTTGLVFLESAINGHGSSHGVHNLQSSIHHCLCKPTPRLTWINMDGLWRADTSLQLERFPPTSPSKLVFHV